MTTPVKGHCRWGSVTPSKQTIQNQICVCCFHAVYPYSSRAGVTKPSTTFIYKGMASSKYITQELLRQVSFDLRSSLGSSQMSNYSNQLMQSIHTGLSWEARENFMASTPGQEHFRASLLRVRTLRSVLGPAF